MVREIWHNQLQQVTEKKFYNKKNEILIESGYTHVH